ncbi:MAG: type II toxin-antitoxin system VapC family toxin [Holosporales bacterium]|jgi:predicted nucleic acid-binding protein
MNVLDSCVIAKWYIDEGDSKAARKLLETTDVLSAPSIVVSEVIAAFSRYFTGGKSTISAEAALEKWRNSLQHGLLRIVDHDFFFLDAMQLSIKLEHAFHDCLYLVHAQRENARLITADKKFARKARLVYPETYLLSEMKF